MHEPIHFKISKLLPMIVSAIDKVMLSYPNAYILTRTHACMLTHVYTHTPKFEHNVQVLAISKFVVFASMHTQTHMHQSYYFI